MRYSHLQSSCTLNKFKAELKHRGERTHSWCLSMMGATCLGDRGLSLYQYVLWGEVEGMLNISLLSWGPGKDFPLGSCTFLATIRYKLLHQAELQL